MRAIAEFQRTLLRRKALLASIFGIFLLIYISGVGWQIWRVIGVPSLESAKSADALRSMLQVQVSILAVLLPVVLLAFQMADRGTLTAVGFVHAVDQRFPLRWLFAAGIWLTVRLVVDGVWLPYPWMVGVDFVLFALFLVWVLLLLVWSIGALVNPTRRRELAAEVLREQLGQAQDWSRQILRERESFASEAARLGIDVSPAHRYVRHPDETVLVPAATAGILGTVDLQRLSAIVEDLDPRAGLTSGDEPTVAAQSEVLRAIRPVLHVRPGDRVSVGDPVALLENLSSRAVPVDEISEEVLACVSYDTDAAAVADRVADLLDTVVDQTDRAIREGSRHRALRGLATLGDVLRWSLASSDGEPLPVAAAGFTASWFFETIRSLSVALETSDAPSMAEPVVSAYLDFAALWDGWELADEATQVLRAALKAGLRLEAPSAVESLAVFVSSSGLGAYRDPTAAWNWSKTFASIVRDALEATHARAVSLLGGAGEQVTGLIDGPILNRTLVGSRKPVSDLEQSPPEAQAAMILCATRLFLTGWERVVRSQEDDGWLNELTGPGNAYDVPGLSVLELALSDEFQARLGAQHWEIFTWGPFGGAGFLTLNSKIVAEFVENREWMAAAAREYLGTYLDDLDDERLVSLKSRLEQLSGAVSAKARWLERAQARVDEILQARRVARPLDPARLLAVRRAWAEAHGEMPSLLGVEQRPDDRAVTDQTTFGVNRLVPRHYFVESHVLADPEQFGQQVGTQMRREALRFWVDTASRHCPILVTRREDAVIRIKETTQELQADGSSIGVLLLNLFRAQAPLEQLEIPVVAEKSWRIQAALVADFQRLGAFYLTPVSGDESDPVEINAIDDAYAHRLVTEEDWTHEGDWAQLDENERILALRDRVHVRILEEYALTVEETSAARVIVVSRDG